MEKLLRETLKDGKFENVSPTRSKAMKAVKWRGNKTTEVKFRLALIRAKLKGWHLHKKGIIGNPDVHFPANKLSIFLDGCFWHGCPRCGHIPRTNNGYWATKIRRNIERDKEKAKMLKQQGHVVIRFWEHELQNDVDKCIKTVKHELAFISS